MKDCVIIVFKKGKKVEERGKTAEALNEESNKKKKHGLFTVAAHTFSRR